MAKAKKEGKPKRNRTNLLKHLKRIKNNQDILRRIEEELK